MATPRTYREVTVTTTTQLRPAAREALQRYARMRDVSLSRVVADAVEEYLAAGLPDFEPALLLEDRPPQDVLDVA